MAQAKRVQEALTAALQGNVQPPAREDGLPTATDTIFQTEHPWDRQPGESQELYERFRKYFLPQGPSRTIADAFRDHHEAVTGKRPPAHKVPGTPWNHAAVDWLWKVRAEAWDNYLLTKEAQEWEERRRALKEWEWRVSLATINLVSEVLRQVGITLSPFPEFLAQAPAQNKGAVPSEPKLKIKLTPTMRPAELAKLLDTASKVGRLSSGMSTEHREVHVDHKNLDEIRAARWKAVAPRLEQLTPVPVPEAPAPLPEAPNPEQGNEPVDAIYEEILEEEE